MKELARSYIEKSLERARNNASDFRADFCINYAAREPVWSAKALARAGHTAETASYLRRTKLTASEKGEILAEAYSTLAADSTEAAGSPHLPSCSQERYRRTAKYATRRAQGLTRAAKRA